MLELLEIKGLGKFRSCKYSEWYPVILVFSLSYWKKEYSFLELYNRTMTTSNLEILADEILDPTSPTWSLYRNHMRSSYGGVLLSERFREYCEAKYVSLDSYTKCIKHYKNYGKV